MIGMGLLKRVRWAHSSHDVEDLVQKTHRLVRYGLVSAWRRSTLSHTIWDFASMKNENHV